jgi:hypothetical protein
VVEERPKDQLALVTLLSSKELMDNLQKDQQRVLKKNIENILSSRYYCRRTKSNRRTFYRRD